MGWVARSLLATAALLLLLVGTAMISSRYNHAADDPVYTPSQFAVANVRAHLQVGQSLRVTGILQPWWPAHSGVIFEPQSQGQGWRWRRIGVFVVFGSPNALVSRLRHLPFVGALVPPTADHPLFNTMATFRLRAISCQASIPLCPWRSPALQLEDGGTG